jgi:hypothetical protein
MSALLTAMASMVVIYYFWPAGAALLSHYGAWQQAGGILRTGLVAGCAGGVLSEVSLVYVRDRGRWDATHLENMAYRFMLFFFSGMVVSQLYRFQDYWFGHGLSWRVLLPKVLVDQFVFTVLWATPYYSLAFRWQALRFSGSRLRGELNRNFVIERMLPVLVTSWMFWIPGVTLVYSMPLPLQMPLNIFAAAIWGLLLAAVSKQEIREPAVAAPILEVPEVLAPSAE